MTMTAKRSRSVLEAVIFVLATVELALMIPYIVHQHRAGATIEADPAKSWIKEGDYQNSKWGTIALYCIPPAITMTSAAASIMLFGSRKSAQSPPRLYAIITAPIMMAMWGTATILWGDCHGQKLLLHEASNSYGFCYISRLKVDGNELRQEYGSVHGVPTSLFGVIIAMASILFFLYVYYTVVAVRDYRRGRFTRRT